MFPQTVKAALSREESPVYKRPPKVNLQLCEYHDYIQELLLNKHLKGSRIFLELKSKGYTGGQTALYSYLKEIKDTSSSSKGYNRTGGEQSQVRWIDYRCEGWEEFVKFIFIFLVVHFYLLMSTPLLMKSGNPLRSQVESREDTNR